jgi:hypothetical protein
MSTYLGAILLGDLRLTKKPREKKGETTLESP